MKIKTKEGFYKNDMKNKKTLIIGSAISIAAITTFGLVVGFASRAGYNGSDPRQGVKDELAKVSSVAFKSDFAPITSDYNNLKTRIYDEQGKIKESINLDDIFDFFTTNGSQQSVYNTPQKYRLVIEELKSDDEKQRFELRFHFEEKLENGKIAKSETIFTYLNPIDNVRSALTSFAHIVKQNFSNLKLLESTEDTSTSISLRPLKLTLEKDFLDSINKLQTSQQVASAIGRYFDISKVKNKITAQTLGYKIHENTDPFQFEFIKNPSDDSQWISKANDQQGSLRLFVKTSFNQEAKKDLQNYQGKDESYIDVITISNDGKSFFADPRQIIDQIDINPLDHFDYYHKGLTSQTITTNSTKPDTETDASFVDAAGANDLGKIDLFDYNATEYFTKLQSFDMNDANAFIASALTNRLRYTFGQLSKYESQITNSLRYQFLPSQARIRYNQTNQRLYIEIPVRISLLESVYGGNSQKVLTSKVVKFKLENFKNKIDLEALENTEISDPKKIHDYKDTGRPIRATRGELIALVKEKKFKEVENLLNTNYIFNKTYSFRLANIENDNASGLIVPPTLEEIKKAKFYPNKSSRFVNQNVFISTSDVFNSRREPNDTLGPIAAFYRSLYVQGPEAVARGLYELAHQAGVEFTTAYDPNFSGANFSDLKNIRFKKPIAIFSINNDLGFNDFAKSSVLYIPFSLSETELHQEAQKLAQSNLAANNFTNYSTEEFDDKVTYNDFVLSVRNSQFTKLRKQLVKTYVNTRTAENRNADYADGDIDSTSPTIALTEMENLQDLLVAFYLQAAYHDGWSTYTPNGSQYRVNFELANTEEELADETKPLKIRFAYQFGFLDQNNELQYVSSNDKQLTTIDNFFLLSKENRAKRDETRRLDNIILGVPASLKTYELDKDQYDAIKVMQKDSVKFEELSQYIGSDLANYLQAIDKDLKIETADVINNKVGTTSIIFRLKSGENNQSRLLLEIRVVLKPTVEINFQDAPEAQGRANITLNSGVRRSTPVAAPAPSTTTTTTPGATQTPASN
ncbi:Uncharacterised protein [Mesomycoplasma conjunctivae]|uniref:Uncharacterized protein n=2 Tax=Mesomycoplasma conjunctivae TaxID=45361 RepID=C5J6B4_MESCH|nr:HYPOTHETICAL PROTEIN MCJ_003150 [Mesomycoplasma conjunctivae]VEU66335.1 Uncharacterised protein [Mesomycoplasma conjunctivae]